MPTVYSTEYSKQLCTAVSLLGLCHLGIVVALGHDGVAGLFPHACLATGEQVTSHRDHNGVVLSREEGTLREHAAEECNVRVNGVVFPKTHTKTVRVVVIGVAVGVDPAVECRSHTHTRRSTREFYVAQTHTHRWSKRSGRGRRGEGG
jgi:hypothetical protein